VTDCYDLSDENNCAMLDFDVNRYRNNYPPVSSDNSKVLSEIKLPDIFNYNLKLNL